LINKTNGRGTVKTIQVTETLHGWRVQIGEEAVFVCAEEEAAFKHALDLSGRLFEQGFPSQVTLARERRAA
jgi:hypothetical protein